MVLGAYGPQKVGEDWNIFAVPRPKLAGEICLDMIVWYDEWGNLSESVFCHELTLTCWDLEDILSVSCWLVFLSLVPIKHKSVNIWPFDKLCHNKTGRRSVKLSFSVSWFNFESLSSVVSYRNLFTFIFVLTNSQNVQLIYSVTWMLYRYQVRAISLLELRICEYQPGDSYSINVMEQIIW